MPSPFPGFDPYLEEPDIWPDFHDALAAEIRVELNRVMPPPYYARLVKRPEIGILEDPPVIRRMVPDVTVMNGGGSHMASATPTAVLDQPRTTASPSVEITVKIEPIHHSMVEIRDASQAHKLVTLIEIVSPSNKRPGQDRRAYEQKQREILDSDASLVEIDFLRAGRRLLPNAFLAEVIDRHTPRPDYIVTVNRWWRRMGDEMDYQLFPLTIRDPLPCITIPLSREVAEPTLDLQWAFNHAYDGGPYLRGAIDYRKSPNPPLSPEDAAWAAELIRPLLRT